MRQHFTELLDNMQPIFGCTLSRLPSAGTFQRFSEGFFRSVYRLLVYSPVLYSSQKPRTYSYEMLKPSFGAANIVSATTVHQTGLQLHASVRRDGELPPPRNYRIKNEIY